MAINMLGEDIYIECQCKSREFIEKEVIALKKTHFSTKTVIKRVITGTVFICEKCGRNCSDLIKKYEVI